MRVQRRLGHAFHALLPRFGVVPKLPAAQGRAGLALVPAPVQTHLNPSTNRRSFSAMTCLPDCPARECERIF
jgi:hypothetical protein